MDNVIFLGRYKFLHVIQSSGHTSVSHIFWKYYKQMQSSSVILLPSLSPYAGKTEYVENISFQESLRVMFLLLTSSNVQITHGSRHGITNSAYGHMSWNLTRNFSNRNLCPGASALLIDDTPSRTSKMHWSDKHTYTWKTRMPVLLTRIMHPFSSVHLPHATNACKGIRISISLEGYKCTQLNLKPHSNDS